MGRDMRERDGDSQRPGELAVDPDLAEAIRGIRQARASSLDDSEDVAGLHPSEILAYEAGILDADERERIEERLVWDERAVTALRDLREVQKGESDAAASERTADAEAEDWQRIQQRLRDAPAIVSLPSRQGAPSERDPSEPPVPVHSKRTAAPGIRGWQALAAALTLVIAGLVWRVVDLGQQLEQIERPRANVDIPVLTPLGANATRTFGEGAVPSLAAGSGPVTLVLNYYGFESVDTYSAVLIDPQRPGAAPRWRLDNLQRTPQGGFILAFSRRGLDPQGYEIQLMGHRDGSSEPLATYPFQVVESSSED